MYTSTVRSCMFFGRKTIVCRSVGCTATFCWDLSGDRLMYLHMAINTQPARVFISRFLYITVFEEGWMALSSIIVDRFVSLWSRTPSRCCRHGGRLGRADPPLWRLTDVSKRATVTCSLHKEEEEGILL